jgi:hypothetical protein
MGARTDGDLSTLVLCGAEVDKLAKSQDPNRSSNARHEGGSHWEDGVNLNIVPNHGKVLSRGVAPVLQAPQ